jgi:hypothetical protein
MERVQLCPGEWRQSSNVSAGQESRDGKVRLEGRWQGCVVSPVSELIIDREHTIFRLYSRFSRLLWDATHKKGIFPTVQYVLTLRQNDSTIQ